MSLKRRKAPAFPFHEAEGRAADVVLRSLFAISIFFLLFVGSQGVPFLTKTCIPDRLHRCLFRLSVKLYNIPNFFFLSFLVARGVGARNEMWE